MRSMTPATDWKEQIAADEEQRFSKHAETLRALQHARSKNGRASRALHAKGQAGVEAEFTILPDLPERARVGLFAKPASYRAYVRFSNGAGEHQHDKKPDVRGIAVKVVGVAGKKLIPGMENAPTQDFLAIRTPSTPFRNADEFVGLIRAASTPALLLPRAFAALGFFRTFAVLKRLVKGLKEPISSLATTHYFSALPIRYGAHAARYALSPRTAADANAAPGRSYDYLADELSQRLTAGPVEYDFQIQFFVDERSTPIEDASRDWDSPYLTVARLTLPRQDPRSPRGQKVAAFIDQLSFDPWHALQELRPLGNMMRARNHAYRASTQERAAAGEPDGSETF